MGFSSMSHWVIVALVVAVIFGARKLPQLGGDFARGIRNFKAGLKEDEGTAAARLGNNG